MLARHHWAVLKASGSPKGLWIFPPAVLNAVAPLALQTLGEHQGMSLQPPQCAHQHRGSPTGREGKLIGKGNHPRTNLFVSHGCFFFLHLFSSTKYTQGKGIICQNLFWESELEKLCCLCCTQILRSFKSLCPAASLSLPLCGAVWLPSSFVCCHYSVKSGGNNFPPLTLHHFGAN